MRSRHPLARPPQARYSGAAKRLGVGSSVRERRAAQAAVAPRAPMHRTPEYRRLPAVPRSGARCGRSSQQASNLLESRIKHQFPLRRSIIFQMNAGTGLPLTVVQTDSITFTCASVSRCARLEMEFRGRPALPCRAVARQSEGAGLGLERVLLFLLPPAFSHCAANACCPTVGHFVLSPTPK